jgi:hypothetical protein
MITVKNIKYNQIFGVKYPLIKRTMEDFIMNKRVHIDLARRLLKVVLTLALALGITLMVETTVSAAENSVTYPLYFDTYDGYFHQNSKNGDVVESGADDLSGGTYSYASGTKTLTIEDVDFATSAATALNLNNLQDFKVELVGENSFTSTYSEAAPTYGIYSNYSSFTILGTGSLRALGGTSTENDSVGIYSKTKAFTISGGTVEATGGSAGKGSYGIQTDACGLTISGGTVKATGGAGGDKSYGIFVASGDSNSFLISDTPTVIAKTTDNTGTALAFSKSATLPAAYDWRAADSGDFTRGNLYVDSQTYLEIVGLQANSLVFIKNGDQGTLTLNNVAASQAQLGGGSYSYDATGSDTNGPLLTLTDIAFTTIAAKALDLTSLPTDATVEFVNTNSFESTYNGTQSATYGIHFGSNSYTISGTGTVMATGGSLTANNYYSYGIGADGSLKISGGTVTATGGSVTGSGNYSYGIRTGSVLKITGGTVTATGGTAYNRSYGINAVGAAEISGGIILVAGGATSNNHNYGILAGSTLTISGGSVEVTNGTSGSISYGINVSGAFTISGTASVDVTRGATQGTSISYGIYAVRDASDALTITGSANVTVRGGAIVDGKSYGIYTYESGSTATLTISGGAVVTAIGGTSTGTGSSYGIKVTWNCYISDSAVVTGIGGTSTGTGSSYGIEVNSRCDISDNAIVTGIGGETVETSSVGINAKGTYSITGTPTVIAQTLGTGSTAKASYKKPTSLPSSYGWEASTYPNLGTGGTDTSGSSSGTKYSTYDSTHKYLKIGQPLTGTPTFSVDSDTGVLTASPTGTNASGTITYKWSGEGVTDSGTSTLDVRDLLGKEITLTMSDTIYMGSITATVTVYKVTLNKSGHAGTDTIISSAYGIAGCSIPIAYTLDGSGTASNTLTFSGVTSPPTEVSTSGTRSATYVVRAADDTYGEGTEDGVITLTATFAHNSHPVVAAQVPTQTVTGTATATFTYEDLATDLDGDAISITAIHTAPNSDYATASLSGGTVTLTGQAPSVQQTTSVVVTITDGKGGTLNVTVPITVNPKTADTINLGSTVTGLVSSGSTYGANYITLETLTSTGGFTATYSIVDQAELDGDYESGRGPVASVDGTTLTIQRPGKFKIRVTTAGSATVAIASATSGEITVARKELTITGVDAVDRAYNATTNVALSGSATLNGIINSDAVTIAASPDAGTIEDGSASISEKTVTFNNFTISGTGAWKYTLTQPTIEVVISKATTSGVPQTVNTPYTSTQSLTFDLSDLLPSVTGLTVTGYALGEETDTNNILGTITYAYATHVGTLTIPLTGAGLAGQSGTIPVTVSSGNYNDFTVNITISIIPARITSVDVLGITEPAVGAAPSSGADNSTNWTAGTVAWKYGDVAAGAKFLGGTAYTGTVTLTTTTNYTFEGLEEGANVKIGGVNAKITGTPGATIVLSRTYAATGAKSIASFAVTTDPTDRTYTTDETLDLSGMTVTLTYNDDTTLAVGYDEEDFSDNGITVSPTHGTTLKAGTHNGDYLSVSVSGVTGSQNTTNALSVLKKAITVTTTAPANITYGGSLGEPSMVISGASIASPLWTYSYRGTMSDNTPGTAYGPTNTEPTNPGVYTVTATLNNDDYSGSDVSEEFTIGKKTLTWNADGVVASKPYDTNTNATVTTPPTLNGLVGSDTVTNITGTVAFTNAAAGYGAIASGYGITGDHGWKYNAPIAQPLFSGIIVNADQSAPTVTLESKTHTSVTLTAITDGEYGYNTTNTAPSTWQDSATFSGLSVNTTYYFFAKLPAKDNYNESPVSAALSVTTNKTPISSVDVEGITIPVVAATPDTTADVSETNYAAAVSWTYGAGTPAGTKFLGSTAYTVTVTLTANTNYTFTGLEPGDSVRIGGANATITGTPGDTLVLKRTYEATGARSVSSFVITNEPTDMSYTTDETLDLTGMTVTLTYNDDTTQAVNYSETAFTNNSITVSPAHGVTLKASTHSGTKLSVSVEGIDDAIQTTNALTVGKANGGAINTGAYTANYDLAATSITLRNEPTLTGGTGQEIEYSRDQSNWVEFTGSTLVFGSLTPDTSYTIYARAKSNSDYNTGTAATIATITTDKATLGGTVTISGSAVYGATLSAVTTEITSTPTVEEGAFSYIWKRDGSTITGATGGTYVLASGDVGTEITVTVTAANTRGTVTSAATSAVVPADYSVTVTDAVDLKRGSGLSALPIAATDGVGVETVDGTLTWYSDSDRTVSALSSDFNELVPGGTKTLYWKYVASDTNYSSTPKTGTTVLTIRAADAQTVSFADDTDFTTGKTGVTKTFNDAAYQITASSTGTGAISYISSNEGVATVEADGTVTITGAGTAVITATAAYVPGAYEPDTVAYTLTVNQDTGAAVSGVPAVFGTPLYNSITVGTVTNSGENEQSVEYAISTANSPAPSTGWQDGTTFMTIGGDSLIPNTTYYVWARTKENTNYTAGTARVSAGISTASAVITNATAPTVPEGTITFDSISGNLSVGSSASGQGGGVDGYALVYKWYQSTDEVNNTASDDSLITGSTATAAIPTDLDAGTYYFYCEVSYTNSAYGAAMKSSVATVTVNPKPITSVNVAGITVPTVADTPDTDATDGTNWTVGTVSWSPNVSGGKFHGSTDYTVTVTLTANANYTFAGLIAGDSVKIGGVNATITGTPGGTLVLSLTYDTTGGKSVSGITVTTQPDISYVTGDTLDLSALVVTLTYNDGTETTNIGYSNFTEYNISTSHDLSNASSLSASDDNGETITLTCNGITTQTSALTVGKAGGAAISGTVAAGSKTDTSITVDEDDLSLSPGTTGQDMEYAYGNDTTGADSDYSTNATISGLAQNTNYYLYARSKENGNYTAGTPSVSAAIKTMYTAAQTPGISGQPVNGTYYINASPVTALSVTASVSDGGTLSYQWYANTSNSNTNGTAITGATSSTYTPPVNAIGTTYYYCVVNNTNSDAVTTTATSTSDVAIFTVNALESNDLDISGTLSVTYGDTRDLTIGTTGNGQAVTWTYSTSAEPGSEHAYTNSTLLPAGSYTVKVVQEVSPTTSGKIVTKTLTIAKKEITIDNENSVIAAKTYDGTTAASITSVAFSTLVGDESFTLGTDYTVSDAAYNDADVADANTVTATIALVATGPVAKNYTLTSGSFSKTATITRAATTLTVTLSDWTYGETANDPSIGTTNPGGGTVTYTYYTDDAGTKGTPLSSPNTKPSDAGTYWVEASVPETANYGAGTSTAVQFTIEKATTTLTVTLSGWTYGENANDPGIGSTNLGGGTVTYTYYADSNNSKGTLIGTTKPTNAGSYWVEASVPETANYLDDTSSAVKFTIAKANAPVITFPTSTGITYGAALSTSTLSGGSTAYGSFAWTNGTTIPTVTNNGYSVTFTPSAATVMNYETIITTTQTVAITVSRGNITPTVNLSGWTYGSPNDPTVSDNSGTGVVDWQYFASDGTTELPEKPSDVGTYYIQATVAQTANYNSGTTNKASFTISQATVASIQTTVNNVTKTAYEARNATTSDAVVTLAALPSTVTVSLSGGGTEELGITWATSTTYDAKGATYAVTGTLTATANVNNAESVTDSVNVIVSAITATNPTFAETQVITNDDDSATAAELGNSVLPTSGSITVQGETIAYTINWNGGQTIDCTDVTDNTVSFTGTISYTDAPSWLTLPVNSVSRAVTVNAKAANTLSITGDGTSTYGDTLTTIDVNSSGGNGTAITWSYGVGESPANWTTFTLAGIGSLNLDAGTYTIKAVQAATALVEGAIVSDTLTIAKKEISINTASSVIAAKTYNGDTTASITRVAFSTLVGAESFTLGTDYTVSGAAFNDADVADANNVTATIALVATGPVAKNYTLTSGSFSKEATITRATTTLIVTLSDWTYGGTANNPSIRTTNPGGGTVTYTYYTDDAGTKGTVLSSPNTKPTDAGTYWVEASVPETANYGADTSTAVQFTIEKATTTLTVTLSGWTYGETANDPGIGSTNLGGGTVTYTYYADSNNSKGTSIGTTKPINAGSYWIEASVPETANYLDDTSSAVKFTIAKAAAPVITFPTSTSITYDAELSTSTLSGGSTAYGSFAWTDGTIKPTVANDGYSVTFTPSAATVMNYETISPTTQTVAITVSRGNITPTVNLSGWTYGAPNDPTVSGNTGVGVVDWQYFESDGTTPLEEKPTDVGTYYIQATVAQTANYNGATTSKVSFTISQATVAGIQTTVNNVTKTAYEARNATTSDAVVTLAALPSTVTVNLTGGGTTELGITWATATTYDPKGTTYVVTGTLTGTNNVNTNSVTDSVNVIITAITATNPTFVETQVITNDDDSATAAELGNSVLPASGNITVQGETIAYTINWNGGQTIDRTDVTDNTVSFTGTISYTDAPAWLTLPANSVSRAVTVNARAANNLSITGDGASTYGDALTTTDVNYSGGNGTAITWSYGVGETPTAWTTFVLDEIGSLNLDAGTYTIKAVQAASTSVNGATVTDILTIAKKQISINATSSVIAAKTYDGTTTANITRVAFSTMSYNDTFTQGTDYTVSEAAFNDADVADADTVTATIALIATGPAAKNYTLTSGSFSKAASINRVTVASIQTTVNNVTKTAYEARNASTNSAVVALAALPSTVTVNLTVGGTAELGITWATATPYNVKGTTYAVTGTLTSTDNINASTVTDSVNVIVSAFTVTNPTFPGISIVTTDDTSATAAELGSGVLPESGSLTVQGESIAYTINWNGGQTIDRTDTTSNTVPFSGTISYTDAPDWLTISTSTVNRNVTVVDKTLVTVSGLTLSNAVYTGTAYAGVSGTLAVTDDLVDTDELIWTWTSTDGGGYSSTTTAPTNAGAYKLTVSVANTNANYRGYVEYTFTIAKATVAAITTTVSDVTKTAYEARNATTSSAVVTLANLPSTVTVSLTDGGSAELGITWTSLTAYDAKGTTYAVTGTLTGTNNYDTNSVTDSVNVTVSAVTATNPTFEGIQIVTTDDTSASAAELGTSILPTSGNISVQGVTIAYTINWNGGQTIDRTDTSDNTVTFTGTVSYTDAPAWLTIPANSVSRNLTTVNKTQVTISGLTLSDQAYTGGAYTGMSGILTVTGGLVDTGTLLRSWTSTDGGGYSSTTTAPTNAGAYKLTVSVPDTNANYGGYVEYTFTISKATLTLTADNKSMTVGEDLPSFTCTVSGLQNSETAVFATAPVVGVVTDGGTTGTFDITFTTQGSLNTGLGSNYQISARTPGTLTVNAFVVSELGITGDGAATYGDVLTTADVNYSGGNGAAITWSYGTGSSPSSWTTFEMNSIGSLKLNAGTYTIKAAQASTDSAEGETVTDTLTIARKQISIDAANSVIAAKTYDGTRKANISSIAFSTLADGDSLTLGTDYTVSGAAYNDANVADANTVTALITLTDSEGAGNYTLTSGRFSKAATITKATVTGIATTVGNVTMSAFAAKDATTSSAVVTLAALPSTVTVNLASGDTAGLGITWATATQYNARGTTYAVTGTLIGTNNYEVNGVTDSVNIIVTTVAAQNSSFPGIQIGTSDDNSVTAAELGENVLPTSGSITVQGVQIAYTIAWGGQTIDRTNTAANTVTFTGSVSYLNAPAWMTIPDNSVSRTMTVVEKSPVNFSGLTVSDQSYTGSAYTGMSGTLTVSGGSVEPDALDRTWTSADGGSYSSTTTAPTDAGAYKLTLSIPDTDTTYYGSAEYEFAITKAVVSGIATTVSDVTKTANEARNAKTNHAVVALASLPETVTVNLVGGGSAELGITWKTDTAYNAAGTTYAVTGTLKGTNNYDTNNITDSVNVVVTPVSATYPTYTGIQIGSSPDASATAGELGESVLPTSGQFTAHDRTIAYTIDWNGGQTINRTDTTSNTVTFTGLASHIDAPSWLSISDRNVSRTVTVSDQSPVTISGLTLSNTVYTGAAYNGVSGTPAVSGGLVDPGDLLWTWTSTDTGTYHAVGQNNAPINAGAYKLTVSVPDTNAYYRGAAEYTFTIAKANLNISTGNYTVNVGQLLPTIVLTFNSFVGRDTADNAFATLPVAAHTVANTNTANTYPIAFTAHAVLNVQNYNITETPGSLTVTPAAPSDDNDDDNVASAELVLAASEAESEEAQLAIQQMSEEAGSAGGQESEESGSGDDQESEEATQETQESLEAAPQDGSGEGTNDSANNEDATEENAPASTQQYEAEEESGGGNVALPIAVAGGVISAGGIGIGGGFAYYAKFIRPKHIIGAKNIIKPSRFLKLFKWRK